MTATPRSGGRGSPSRPGDRSSAASTRPVHYAFVLDRSHSITPELWTVARSVVQAMSTSLGQDDRMTVLACDSACDVAPGGLATAAQAMPAADAFLDQQILAGASDVGGMMRSAAEALNGADAGINPQTAPERVIVYLGDGSPSAGELAPDELLRHLERPLAGTRVQAVALGARSDLLLLDALTRRTGGDLLRADAKDDLRGLVRELRLRAEVPVARDVSLTLPRGLVYVHPQQLAAGLAHIASLPLKDALVFFGGAIIGAALGTMTPISSPRSVSAYGSPFLTSWIICDGFCRSCRTPRSLVG